VILIIAVIIFLIVLRQKNIELARHEMENQIILLEQKSQQAMMNPHFIFNVLGSIQNYLLRNQPNEAGIYLSQFARLIRQNLKATSSSMINLDEEIDRLKDYLELEKLRMGNKFDYLIEKGDGLALEDLFIPAMIVQPFVENAVWHGISPLEEKGVIRISFRMKDEKSLQIIVEDNGIGIANAAKNSNNTDSHLKLGTNIISKRLELLSKKYETETHVLYSEQSPGNTNPGTKVEIVVPFLFE
jgi:LytS/YehU family sensor histidine kinase